MRQAQGPVVALRTTRGRHVVHLNQFPSFLKRNVEGVSPISRMSKSFHENVGAITKKFHVLPIWMINSVANLAIQPIPCTLAIRHSHASRTSRAPSMGGNGRRREITKNLQVSVRIMQIRTLAGAAGQLGSMGQHLFGVGSGTGPLGSRRRWERYRAVGSGTGPLGVGSWEAGAAGQLGCRVGSGT